MAPFSLVRVQTYVRWYTGQEARSIILMCSLCLCAPNVSVTRPPHTQGAEALRKQVVMAARAHGGDGSSSSAGGGGSGRRRGGGGGGDASTGDGPVGPLLRVVNSGIPPAPGFCREVRAAIDDEGR